MTACPVACQAGDVDNNNAQVTDVWNISSHMVNEARIGYTAQLNFFADLGTGQGDTRARRAGSSQRLTIFRR